jgi:hypothetical protein
MNWKAMIPLSLLALGLGKMALGAGPCDPASITGELQLVPLDGSAQVIGAVPLDQLGWQMNPIQGEQRADGVIELKVYETVVAPKLGQLLATLGTIEIGYEGAACRYMIMLNGVENDYLPMSMNSKGAIVLADVSSPGEPALVIRKIRK